jgi:tetratricopeptide (TPR) repeat protein
VLAAGCVYYNTFYLARRNFRDAELLREAAAAGAQSPPARTNELYQKSLVYALKVIENHPESRWIEEAFLLSQMALFHLGNTAASVRKGEEFLAAFPESPQAPRVRFFLARGWSRLGQPERALAEIGRAAGGLEYPMKVEAILLQAELDRELGRYEEGLSCLESLERIERVDPTFYRRAVRVQAELLAAQDRYPEALEQLDRILLDPALSSAEAFDLQIRRIEFLLETGDRPAVEKELEALRLTDTAQLYAGLIHYFQGTAFRNEGKDGFASGEFQSALLQGAPPAWEFRIRMDLARSFEAGDQYAQACSEYRPVAAGSSPFIDPDDRIEARARIEAITQWLTLLSLVHRLDPALFFDDPRGTRPAREQPTPEDEAALREADDPPGIFLYLLAEHAVFALNRPDSGRACLQRLAERSPPSALTPRALFAIAGWPIGSDPGGEIRDSALRRLEEEYPDSEWTYYLRVARGGGDQVPLPAELRARAALLEAERTVDPLADAAAWQPAVGTLLEISRTWDGTDSARRALLAAARLMELGAGAPDSARAAYQAVVRRYPGTAEARIATDRLEGSQPVAAGSDSLVRRKALIAKARGEWERWLAARPPTSFRRIGTPAARPPPPHLPSGGTGFPHGGFR